MTLQPLLAAPPVIQLHVAAAALAVALTVVQLAGVKGTGLHRTLGYGWAAAMLTLAATGLFIHTLPVIGPFSPIHLLSLLVLVQVPHAVWAARRGRVAAHRKSMTALVVGALAIAGAFTLWPGRMMHAVIFGG
jgi:uncharacterized membrane protein